MSKHIYECEKSYYDSKPIKNQYTVVYENKTYYYCKVNGTDELKHFTKANEDKIDFRGCFWSINDFDVTTKIKQFEEEQRQKEIANTQRRISQVEQERERLSKRLAEMNDEYLKLTNK
jgi:flagellar motility protein MotE (MotC chaperone)